MKRAAFRFPGRTVCEVGALIGEVLGLLELLTVEQTDPVLVVERDRHVLLPAHTTRDDGNVKGRREPFFKRREKRYVLAIVVHLRNPRSKSVQDVKWLLVIVPLVFLTRNPTSRERERNSRQREKPTPLTGIFPVDDL